MALNVCVSETGAYGLCEFFSCDQRSYWLVFLWLQPLYNLKKSPSSVEGSRNQTNSEQRLALSSTCLFCVICVAYSVFDFSVFTVLLWVCFLERVSTPVSVYSVSECLLIVNSCSWEGSLGRVLLHCRSGSDSSEFQTDSRLSHVTHLSAVNTTEGRVSYSITPRCGTI